jgi:hypothetical protein
MCFAGWETNLAVRLVQITHLSVSLIHSQIKLALHNMYK